MPDHDRRWIDDLANSIGSYLSAVNISKVDGPKYQLPIRPLRTVQTLDPDELLAVLNSKDEESKEGSLARTNRISVRLRKWIDEWLDSGKAAVGLECPASRNYGNAKTVSDAVYTYSTRGKMHLVGTEDGLELWFDLQSEKMQPASKGWPQEYFVDMVAREKLVLFLLSDLSYKLAKCREPKCGRYFVLKHWNRNYQNGTFCEDCQRARSLRSAASATVKERKRAEVELYTAAAKRFNKQVLKDKNWHRQPRLKAQIAKYLSERIDRSSDLVKVYPKGITGKWIATRKNWNAIEATAKRGGLSNVSVSL